MEKELEIYIDIYTACNLGDEDVVREILERAYINVNERNTGGWTPVMYACWGGHDKLVSMLLNAGARKDYMNSDNQTPLIVAVKSGCFNTVKLVCQKDLLDHTDNYGKCALFYAVDFGYYDISSYLIKEGANINFRCDGKTVLMVAAMSGQRSLVELLLNHGANIQIRNNKGFTAQQLAATHQHLDIAAMVDTTHHADLPDLKSFLRSLGLEKYWPIFQENKIDFEHFLQMDEAALKALGVKLLGPRRKMSLGIAGFIKRNPKL